MLIISNAYETLYYISCKWLTTRAVNEAKNWLTELGRDPQQYKLRIKKYAMRQPEISTNEPGVCG